MNTFSEKQRFTQWWIWLIIIAINLLLVYIIINVIIDVGEKSFHLADLIGLAVVFFSLILVNYLLSGTSLKTEINEKEIKIKFIPFIIKDKIIKWEDLSLCYVRQYNPIGEYGGWGYRFGIMGKGKAYNINGNIGLQLQFKDGKKLLIGTQKAEELKQFLLDINQYKE